jgi:peptidoglycan hydrolase-like protein with peptidoglycan-binding domain
VTGGVVRWGGDYTGRKDGMHFELNDGTTEAQCSAALARLRGSSTGAPVSPTGQVATAGGNLANGSRGEAVTKLQRVLAAWYPDLRLVADGVFGPATEAAVRRLQTNARLTVDGIAGPRTLHALGLA